MPSDTGAPGGKTTGQHMSDYPLPGGRFYRACVALETNHDLPLADRLGLFEAKQKQRNRLSPELMQALHEGLEQMNTSATSVAHHEDGAGSFPLANTNEEMVATASLLEAEQVLYQPFPEQFALAANDEDEVAQQLAAKRVKVCYQCPSCGMKVWGKPDLSVICGDCHQSLLAN
jgi:putative zinc metalloproteinase